MAATDTNVATESTGPAMSGGRATARDRSSLVAAAGAGLAASLGPLLRPPIPLDETRYVQVFRELQEHGGWVLTLNQVPYTEKTPLLFWLGRALHFLGVPGDLALRLVPMVCVVGTVLVLARLARRLDAPLAPWLQAAALLPLLWTQLLLFDSLVTLTTWASLTAWSEGRDRRAGAWAAAALFAKGPIALLFLLPFGWALAALRPRAEGAGAPAWRRGALLLALAVLPLLAWVLLAIQEHPEIAGELLWDKWGGRLGGKAAHAQPFWFYLPIVAAGSLPFFPALLTGGLPPRQTLMRRLAVAAGVCLLCLSAIRGKQAHYLLPMVPALALWAGVALSLDARATRMLAVGAGCQLGMLALALGVLLLFGWDRAIERYGELATALRDDVRTRITFLLAFGGIAVAAFAWIRGLGVRVRMGALCLANVAVLVPLHHAAGELSLPRSMGSLLRSAPERPLATFDDFQAGFYNLLSGRTRLEKIEHRELLERWWTANPDGLVVAEEDELDLLDGLDFEVLLRDRLRGKLHVILELGARDDPHDDASPSPSR